ncbi:uncharacterized protein LOC130813258 isoform X2 [Amaranthus tricolor]|uniref:uncharacterized protein LOC130813258 isoform X2 n=1 Tax=Amaranthus tricolor TaxID=29722 RepID=UPI002587FA2D|nr:uncharacterized protein LOC130813258 isoform X2 [Amaranthus tricolor]
MNEVKEGERCIADFPYGGFRHKWTQPKEDDSPALYVDANFDKTFRIDDISSVFHYELIIKNGGLNSDVTGKGNGEIRCSELDSDEEYEPVSSGFNIRKSMKRSDRRKNTKPWTLDEVAALINGMSQFGTGQWTSVKRAFFSSSSRTATDISDKWRNLVKKNIQISKAGKDDQHQWNGSQPFPKTLMCYESSPFIQYLYCFGKEKKKTEKGTKTKRKEKRGFCDFRFSQHQLDQVVDRRSSRGPILLKFGELVLDI